MASRTLAQAAVGAVGAARHKRFTVAMTPALVYISFPYCVNVCRSHSFRSVLSTAAETSCPHYARVCYKCPSKRRLWCIVLTLLRLN